ncbi:MAG TPA: hypothetical protein VNO75_12145 [Gemmatimonadaceae bacterium]|nr:hypothetical protein [Gemmatimonadaceae bacterium]
MLSFLLFAQVSIAPAPGYSSAAVRDLVTRAVVANRAPPPELRGYRARVESEFSINVRDTLGRERAAQIEQLASRVTWTRDGNYDMHVVGYRSQSLGSPVSTLSFVHGWTEPTLYGDRLQLGVQLGAPPDSNRRPRRGGGNWLTAVHPFSYDRDRYYSFSGGDTVVTMRSNTRLIRLVRVQVKPKLGDATRLAAFDGEIDLDADRHQIVRMRGQFVVLANRGRPTLSPVPGVTGVVYIEFVNAEIDGRYWLPAFQRTELQSTFAMLGNQRAIMRIVSRFSEHTLSVSAAPLLDSTVRNTHTTTWAPSDSVSRFNNWDASLGVITTDVNANDFDDVAPDAWRPTGRPRLDISPTRTENVFRYNRVEGLFTGLEANYRMRSAVPGLSMGGSAGWAWTQQTVRGGGNITLRRDPWTTGLRAERLLSNTNDFIPPLNPENGGLAAMFGSVDDFDYVDRRIATASVSRVMGGPGKAIVTLQGGAGNDRPEISRLEHGVTGGGTFRPNRGAAQGTYGLGVFEAELHPGVSGDFLQPGLGGRVHYEVGSGTLDWQRAEVMLAGRKYLGRFAFSLQADAGAVYGDTIPPQQLFELGGSGALPGYEYKEFAGDRAALLRSQVTYAFPIWRMPLRVWTTLFIPGFAPGIAAGIQGGWTDISTPAAQTAVDALGAGFSVTPVSRATDGFRATASVGLTFFSGSAHIGFARPIDHQAPWKFVWGLGHSF